MGRYLFAVIAAGLALTALIALSLWYVSRPTQARVAVTRDSPDHHLMAAAASIMAREH